MRIDDGDEKGNNQPYNDIEVDESVDKEMQIGMKENCMHTDMCATILAAVTDIIIELRIASTFRRQACHTLIGSFQGFAEVQQHGKS